MYSLAKCKGSRVLTVLTYFVEVRASKCRAFPIPYEQHPNIPQVARCGKRKHTQIKLLLEKSREHNANAQKILGDLKVLISDMLAKANALPNKHWPGKSRKSQEAVPP